MKTIKEKFKQTAFVESFKSINKETIKIVMYDLLTLFSFAMLTVLLSKILQLKAKALNLVDLSTIMQQTTEEISANAGVLKSYLMWVSVGFIIYFLIAIVVISFLQGKLASVITKIKFRIKGFRNFSVLNLVIAVILIVILLILTLLINQTAQPYLLLIAIVFLVYTLPILYAVFSIKPEKKSVKKAFRIAFKTWKFLLTYLMTIIVFVIVSLILWPITYLPQKLSTSIIVLVYLIYIAWFRQYLFICLERITKK